MSLFMGYPLNPGYMKKCKRSNRLPKRSDAATTDITVYERGGLNNAKDYQSHCNHSSK